jgi:hypothetical protein
MPADPLNNSSPKLFRRLVLSLSSLVLSVSRTGVQAICCRVIGRAVKISGSGSRKASLCSLLNSKRMFKKEMIERLPD